MKNSPKVTVADLSHEIRNRLTYIMLSSNVLRSELQTILSDKQRREFSNIDSAAEKIRGLLDNLDGLLLTELAEARLKEAAADLLIGG
jgi:signal transduction histidine kinase